MASAEKLGWFGLGSMGICMALNLQQHLTSSSLPALHYSNRTLSKGKELDQVGAVQEDTFESLVRHSTIIFTMISNDTVLNDLVECVTEKNLPLTGKVWVDFSTVHPKTSANCSEILAHRGAAFVASPVFGASSVAAAGKLIFSMAGLPDAIDRLRPYIINVMGAKIIFMGSDVRKSGLLKIAGNIFVIGFQELVAEGLVFAETTGLGTDQMEQFIGSMFGQVLESYSKRMTSGAYAPPLGTPPGFAAALAVKDAEHALSLAAEHKTRIPTIETALARLIAARQYAGESLDSSSLYGMARLEAGMSFWSEKSRQGNETDTS